MPSRGSGRTEGPQPLRFWLAAAGRLARHPSLWGTAVVQAGRLSPPQWWRRPPFLPVPDRDYLRFRLETQYGQAGMSAADPEDLVVYLRWCRGKREVRDSGAA